MTNHHNRRAPQLSGASGVAASHEAVEEAIQQLSGLNIGEREAVYGPETLAQLSERVAERTRVKRDVFERLFREGLRGKKEDIRSFCSFVSNLSYLLYVLRLHSNLEDIHAELWYNASYWRGVQVKIWIHVQDWDYAVERAETFERYMDETWSRAAQQQLNWDEVQLVWRISYSGSTWSRQDASARWPSQSGHHNPLSDCLRRLPNGMLNLGWFADEYWNPPNPELRRHFDSSTNAELTGNVWDPNMAWT
ncbi:hypothetical protein F5B21DRAFT_499248 [Xylaria acuta]|nr:hypothetical protein F5B21DRAFT_499248 [Xylaria acuta]